MTKRAFIIAIAALCLALSGPALGPSTAHAQEVDESYVDLSVEISVGISWTFTARNNGTATAYGVTIDIELGDQAIAIDQGTEVVSPEFEQASGSTCSGNIPGTTCLSGVFSVATLEPGEEKSFLLRPKLAPGLPCCTNLINDYWIVPARAVVKNTFPEEEERFKGDNTDTGWIYANGHDSPYDTEEPITQYSLEASVDDLLPEAGDTVTFSFLAITEGSLPHTADAKLRLKLSKGLGTPTATPSSGTTFAAAPGLTRTWDWNIGQISRSRVQGVATSLEVSTTLDDPLPAGVSRSDLCLTAELTARPDDSSPGDTTAEICLREYEGPVVLLQEGEATLFTMYPCVGVTAYPCSDEDTIEMWAVLGSAARAAGIARDEVILRPERVFVQVKDPEGRRIDTYSRSVNSGTAPSWHTARQDHSNIESAVDGVNVRYTRREFTAEQRANYNRLVRTVSVAGLDGASAPGLVKIRYPVTGNAEFEPNPSHERANSPFPSLTTSIWNRFVEFSTLGTYKIDYTAAATHNSGTPSDTTDDVVYSGTGSYIFHVGPVAELGVRDGGATPGVAADQRAYSIVAVNNGPDDAPAVRVTLTGLSSGSYVSHTATAGTFDPDTGVWTIGELRKPSDHRNIYGRDGLTLTIITSVASARDITAAISNTRDYTVCIDSSGEDVAASSESACTATSGNTWHSAAYYDHRPGNNTAAIRARGGTGAAHPEATINLRVLETRVGNILLWQPVDTVSGRRVTHYEVQRWASPWATLASRVAGTVYVDLDGRAGADYRVRAVNDRGQEGPWSITGRPPEMPGNFSVTLSDGGNAAVLSWTEPASPSPITGYVIDIADTADGDSRTNDRTVGGDVTTWTHTGLSEGGDVKFYRVHARNRDGIGLWTAWKSVGTGPGAPGSLRARASGQSEIVLTWTAASSRDTGISQYELDYSDFSRADGYRWNALTVVYPYEGLRYVDGSLAPGTTRYYRVRAYTAADQPSPGAWSNVASATTSEAGPAPPVNLSAVADGENRIRVTWDASTDASSYNIEHSTDGETWEPERTRHTGTCSVGGQTVPCYTDSGLLSGTTHHYRVAGVNRSGAAGEWSASVSATTAGDTTEPPGEPENLRITGVSGRQVSLSWDPPQNDGGLRVTGYEYMVQTACAHDPGYICQVIKPTRTGGTSATVTVPNVRGHYEFSVRALSAAGAGWWTQPVGQYIDPRRTWRVTLSPSSLRVDEGGEATYRVRLSSDPGRPVMLALWWDGDPDVGSTLSHQQFKWLLPSNYQNPEIFVDPHWSSPWNTGVTITVTADEDADTDNGTLEIHNSVYNVPCADLGSPSGCVDDPEDTGITAYITVTERDND